VLHLTPKITFILTDHPLDVKQKALGAGAGNLREGLPATF